MDRHIDEQTDSLLFACRLLLIVINMKFHEVILKGFQVIKRTRFSDGQSSNGNNSKSINERIMVLALCISSNVD